MSKDTPKFEGPWDYKNNKWKFEDDPGYKEYAFKRSRERDKNMVMGILYHDPDLLQEVLSEIRKLKMKNILK